MKYDKYAVIKVKDADPEVFLVVWVDSHLPKNGFMQTGQELTESDLRAELARMGRTEQEINSLIKDARDNPK